MPGAEYFPLPSEGVRGGKDNEKVTATCYCGEVQLLLVSYLTRIRCADNTNTGIGSPSKHLVSSTLQCAIALIAGR